jgi:hypothetical protein
MILQSITTEFRDDDKYFGLRQLTSDSQLSLPHISLQRCEFTGSHQPSTSRPARIGGRPERSRRIEPRQKHRVEDASSLPQAGVKRSETIKLLSCPRRRPPHPA